MKGDLRCIDGRLWRHDPVPFDPTTGDCDPYFEMDIGECPDCNGIGCDKLCEHCEEPTLGVTFNDDGEFLCTECLVEWAIEEGYEHD